VVDYRILLVEAARPTLTASSGPWEHFSFKYFSFLWLFMIAVTYTVPVADLSSFASHCAFWLTTGCCGRVETCFPVYGVEGWGLVWGDGLCRVAERRNSVVISWWLFTCSKCLWRCKRSKIIGTFCVCVTCWRR
jgi:hypothetical protein